ncbi:MAG: TonB-dependent receptor [Bermanella sp.]
MIKQLLAFISLLPLFGSIQAQQAMDFFSLSLEELMHIEITGPTLTPQELKVSPSAVTVFSQGQLEQMGINTLDELVNIVPGFQAYRSGQSPSRSPITARGRRIGSPSPEILVIIDGQRLDDPRSHSFTNILPKFPLKHIKQVEFIRGPGSAIYGSNAMMAIINIMTRKDENELSASVGNNNMRQVDLLSSQSLNNINLNFYAHIEKDDGEEYQVQDGFSNTMITTDDPQQWLDLNLKLDWKNSALNIIHLNHDSSNFYELGNLSNDFNEHSGQFSAISIKQKFNWSSFQSFAWLSYSESGTEFKAQLSANGSFSPISNPSSSEPLLVEVDFTGVREVRALWHNDWEINTSSSFQFGVEHREISVPKVTAGNNFDVGQLVSGIRPIQYYNSIKETTVIQLKSSRNIGGIYGQYQNEFSPGIHLILGSRYDDFSGVGSKVSPRIGLVTELSKHHTIKALYGEAFRAPSEGELGLTNNPVIIGNPNLKAETVQTLDLIWLGEWPSIFFSLGYFENKFEDSIVLQPTDTGLRKYGNQDEDPSKGIEFEISFEPIEHWLLRGSYTQLLENSNTSNNESDEMTSVLMNYSLNKWNANLVAVHHGSRITADENEDDNEKTINSYWLLFSKIEYQYTQNINLNLQARNLLNEDYTTPSRSGNAINGVPNRGRELSLGVNWLF